MPTLVTGATGVIGPRLVKALLERGDEVRVFARPSSDVSVLDGSPEIVRGDITDADAVKRAVSGCRRIFHLAAVYESWVPKQRTYFDVNVGGTVNVLEAALESGIERMVHASSASTIGEAEGETGNEETAHRGYFLTNYERSKWEAEQLILEYVEKGVPAVMVNPTSVYGPGDLTGNGLTLKQLLNGRITATTPSMASYVFIDDLVKGLLAADEKGVPGERYILTGSNLPRNAFLRLAAEIAGITPVISLTPVWVIRVIVWMHDIRHKLTGKAPGLSRSAAAVAMHGFQYDGSKAARELGIEFTSLEDGLDATIDWLYREGHVELPDEVLVDSAEDDEPLDESEDRSESG